MKILLCICFLLFIYPAISQDFPGDFYQIDRKVRAIKSGSVDSLAVQLAALGKTDLEKVRAIFRWITEHIEYNVSIFSRNKRTSSTSVFSVDDEDSLTVLRSLSERVAAKVLKRKVALCDGYSRLFKTLCDYTGIKSEIIHGYARTNMNRGGQRFGVNHTWNAVYIENKWYLLDVTWASGFISQSDEFIRHHDDYYFLTPPDQFIRDHYPEDLQWALMPDPPAFREFQTGPFRYGAFFKSGISSFFPLKGIIEAEAGDSVNILLTSRKSFRNFIVSETPITDWSDSVDTYKVPDDITTKVFTCTISNPASEWLYVYYNDELVMRYRLELKKENASRLARADRLRKDE